MLDTVSTTSEKKRKDSSAA
jgi:hypothetical protein